MPRESDKFIVIRRAQVKETDTSFLVPVTALDLEGTGFPKRLRARLDDNLVLEIERSATKSDATSVRVPTDVIRQLVVTAIEDAAPVRRPTPGTARPDAADGARPNSTSVVVRRSDVFEAKSHFVISRDALEIDERRLRPDVAKRFTSATSVRVPRRWVKAPDDVTLAIDRTRLDQLVDRLEIDDLGFETLVPGRWTDRPTPEPDRGPIIDPDVGPIGDADPLFGYEYAFDRLDDALPLALLPVRLETRYFGPERGEEHPTLRVRVFPDLIHADAHQESLHEVEIEAGESFWKATWDPESREKVRTLHWNELVRRFGAPRAGWVIRSTVPINIAQRPEVAGEYRPPRFDDRVAAALDEPLRAMALPTRWALIGFLDGTEVFAEWTNNVDPDLLLSPDPNADEPVDGADLAVGAGMEWMVDYDVAVDVGMAKTIVLDRAKQDIVAAQRLDELVVVGLTTGTTLDDVLTAHRYSRGCVFVENGAPTNNTDDAESAMRAVPPDSEAWLDVEEASALGRSLDDLGDDTNTRHVGRALGFDDAGVDLLARTELGERPRHAWNEAINDLMWRVTFGQLLGPLAHSHQDRDWISDSMRAFVRRFHRKYVRGGGWLPSLRIGNQPYGVLPVMQAQPQLGFSFDNDEDRQRQQLGFFLSSIERNHWTPAVPSVPNIDPDATDEVGKSIGTAADEMDDAIVRILSANPNPARFWTNEFDANTLVCFQYGLWGLAAGVDEEMQDSFTDIDDQYDRIEALIPPNPEFVSYAHAALQIVGWHRDRVEMARAVMLSPRPSGVLPWGNPEDPLIFFGTYSDAPDPWQQPVVVADDATDEQLPFAYLNWLADHYLETKQWPPPGFDDDAPQPLLLQLVRSVLEVGEDEEPEPITLQRADDLDGRPVVTGGVLVSSDGPYLPSIRRSIRTLADVHPDQLDVLLRESLGLASHRLDAWMSAFANERLDDMRVEQPTGLQLGGVGWVVDLRFDDADGDNHGFVVARSLAHATTAAVLRSGWLAHGAAEAESAFAVDIRSHRMRDARWMLEGVSAGLSPARLLGWKFERTLHDLELDAFIHDFRDAVTSAVNDGTVEAGDDEDEGPLDPVNGMLLLDLADAEGPTFTSGHVAAAMADATTDETRAVGGVLADLASIADAVADAAMAESVYQLVSGDVDAVTATLDAVSTGELPPPELDVAVTPRRFRSVDMRVVVPLCSTEDTSWSDPAHGYGWSDCAPQLESWAATMLGDPARITMQVSASMVDHDGEIVDTVDHELTVADVQVTALQFVEMAPRGAGAERAEWKRCVAAALTAKLQPSDANVRVETMSSDPDSGVSLADAWLIARRIRRVLNRSRPTEPRDLERSSSLDDRPRFLNDLELAASSLQRDFTAVLRDLRDLGLRVDDGVSADDRLAVAKALRPLASYGIDAAWVDPTLGDVEFASAVSTALRHTALRRDAAQAVRDAEFTDDIERARSLVHAIMGRNLLLPATFSPESAKELDENASFGAERLASPLEPFGWLGQHARVRDGIARLHDLMTTCDLVHDATVCAATVTQFPHLVDPATGTAERWAATALPLAEPPARTSVVYFSPDDVVFSAERSEPFCGITVDEWTDAIPVGEHSAAATFHFDAPTSRAPQSVLLMVPRTDGDGWTFDNVVTTVRETIANARRRMVGFDQLEGVDHYLPAIFSPVALSGGTK